MSHFDNSYLFSFDEGDVEHNNSGSNICPSCNGDGYLSDDELARVSYWKNEVIRLARFLREIYPDAVNGERFNRDSSAVDLAIKLLSRPTPHAVDGAYCDCESKNFTKYHEGVYLCGLCGKPRH